MTYVGRIVVTGLKSLLSILAWQTLWLDTDSVARWTRLLDKRLTVRVRPAKRSDFCPTMAPIPGPESSSVERPPCSPCNKTLLRCLKTFSRALLPKVLILEIILCSSFCYFHMALKTNFSPFLCSPLWVDSCWTTSALMSTRWNPLSFFPNIPSKPWSPCSPDSSSCFPFFKTPFF